MMSSGGQLQLKPRPSHALPSTAPEAVSAPSCHCREQQLPELAGALTGRAKHPGRPNLKRENGARVSAHAALVRGKFSRAAFAASVTDLWKREGAIREPASSRLLLLQLARDFSALGPINGRLKLHQLKRDSEPTERCCQPQL